MNATQSKTHADGQEGGSRTRRETRREGASRRREKEETETAPNLKKRKERRKAGLESKRAGKTLEVAKLTGRRKTAHDGDQVEKRAQGEGWNQKQQDGLARVRQNSGYLRKPTFSNKNGGYRLARPPPLMVQPFSPCVSLSLPDSSLPLVERDPLFPLASLSPLGVLPPGSNRESRDHVCDSLGPRSPLSSAGPQSLLPLYTVTATKCFNVFAAPSAWYPHTPTNKKSGSKETVRVW